MSSPFRMPALMALALALACTPEGTEREASTSFFPIEEGQDEAPAKSDGKGGTEPGDGPGGLATPANSRTLEQCTAEKKAWRAVVDGGKSPSDCVEQLVDWCCTRAEVLARFPTMATALDAKFATAIDADKNVLYHCSYDDATKRYKFHMGKIASTGSVSYKWLYVEQVFPVDTGNDGSCAEVKTDDLRENGTTAEADDAATE